MPLSLRSHVDIFLLSYNIIIVEHKQLICLLVLSLNKIVLLKYLSSHFQEIMDF